MYKSEKGKKELRIGTKETKERAVAREVETEPRSMFFFSSSHTHLLSASGQAVVTGGRPLFPPVLSFNFYRALGSAIPLLVDFFSSSVANSRSRAFRKSICAQEKVPTNLFEYALGRIRTHETDVYQPGSRIT